MKSGELAGLLYQHVSYMVSQSPDRLASSTNEHVSYMVSQSPDRLASSTNMSVTWSYSPLIGWPPLLTCHLHGLPVPKQAGLLY